MNNEKNLNIPRYNLIFNFQSLLQFQQQRLKNIVTFHPHVKEFKEEVSSSQFHGKYSRIDKISIAPSNLNSIP